MYFDGKGLLALAATVASKRTARLGAIAVAILLLATLTLAACASDEEDGTGGTLRVGMLADYSSFDPQLLLGMPDIVTAIHTYDVLVFRNPDLSLQPQLAESWESNADGTQWTFNLRKGVRFSHGKELKAEDVIFTFRRMFEVESPLASVMLEPTDIVAVNDYTVRFEFAEPNAVLMDALVKYHAHIAPSDVDPARFVAETFGTGPFIMTEHVIGERTTFKKNPDYWWDGHPLVDELEFIFLPNPETRVEALKAGTIDVIFDMETASVPVVRDYPETSVLQAPSGGYMNLAMDVREPPFDNKLVRKAIQAATDRNAILQGAQFGLGSIAFDHPITEGHPFFNPSYKPPDYDPELAKDLLAQAGYPDGINLTLHTATAGAAMVEMATVMKERAAPAGINIEIVVMSEDGYWSDGWLVKPFTTVWWGGRPPYEAFSVVYAGDAAWNESYWKNAEFDALLATAAGQPDPADQKQTYQAMQCLVVEEVPRIVTVFRPVVLGIRTDVRGLEPMWDATMSLHRTWLDR